MLTRVQTTTSSMQQHEAVVKLLFSKLSFQVYTVNGFVDDLMKAAAVAFLHKIMKKNRLFTSFVQLLWKFFDLFF